jgi:uncharacterized membrane protein YbhN (UPF0104 family)
MDRRKAIKGIKVLLKILIGVTALAYVLYKIDLRQAAELLSEIRIAPFAGAILLFIASKLASAWRQNTLLTGIGIGIGLKRNIRLYWKGMFYNFFLPGGISGDGYKVIFLAKRFTQPNRDIFLAILYDRLYGVIVLISFLFGFWYFVPFYPEYRFLAFIAIPLVFALTWLFTRIFSPCHLRSFFSLVASSFAVQAFQLVCCLLLLVSLRISSDYTDYLFIFLVSSLVAVLPVTIGGMGAREITFYYFSGLLSLETNASVMISLLFFLISLAASVPGFFFSLRNIKGNKIAEHD